MRAPLVRTPTHTLGLPLPLGPGVGCTLLLIPHPLSTCAIVL